MPKIRLAKKVDETNIVGEVREREYEASSLKDSSLLVVTDYTDKSIVVTGDTISHSTSLKQLGGSFNPKLRCGAGWIFSKARKESVENYIKTGVVEPFIFDKNSFKKEDNKDAENLVKTFRMLKDAFNDDEEYDGETVLDVIQKIENKIMNKNVVLKSKPEKTAKETKKKRYSSDSSDSDSSE